MVVERGSIWWADLPNPIGSEPGFRRPVLVIQSDDFNRSAIRTILAVTLTSNLSLAEFPGNSLLLAEWTGLARDSVVNASQVVTLDRTFFRSRIGKVNQATMTQIEAGLRLVMGL